MPDLPNNANFVAAIQAMTIANVSKHYDFPPASVDIAGVNNNCAFPLLPGADRGEQVSTCINNSKARTIGYVVIVEATGQGTPEQNYAKLAAAMDNLEAALDGLAPDTVNFINYDITTSGNFPIGDSEYWAVIATVTASDL